MKVLNAQCKVSPDLSFLALEVHKLIVSSPLAFLNLILSEVELINLCHNSNTRNLPQMKVSEFINADYQL